MILHKEAKMGLKDVYHLLKIDLHTVFLSCLIFSTSNSLKLTTKNSRDGSESFIKCETVTFECVIQPYTDTLSWKYDKKEVAACSFATCQPANDVKEFGFTFDTNNGIFQLKIDKVKDEYNSKLFECFDGINTKNVTAKLDDIGWKSHNFAILFAVIIFVNIIAVILNAVCCCKTSSSLRKTIKGFWFPLVYFVVGVLLIVILILVTRFSEDSVVEEYDNICAWGILLILFGIYVFVAICLFVALTLIVLYR